MGLDGKPFMIYKFRSMYDDAEATTGPVWRSEDDPRRTPIGRMLRRSNSTNCRSCGTCCAATCRSSDRARSGRFRRAVQAQDPAVHAAPQGEGRHHRLGAGATAGAATRRSRKRIEYDLYYIENWSVRSI
jgi:lipopolysaccharide/colanic/teichoic acid biosynthesis glycosyltransferase